MVRFHQSLYSITFKVRDLRDAEQYLESKGVKFTLADDTILVTDADTTNGCIMAFTTSEVPGDPRSDWTALTGDVIPAKLFRGG